MALKIVIKAILISICIDISNAASCTSWQIENLDLNNGCDCFDSSSSSGCNACTYTYCHTQIPTKYSLAACHAGCVDANLKCESCNIYFGSLCQCIGQIESGHSTSCVASNNPVPKSGPPIWMLLGKHDLITTSQRMPGILELGQATHPNEGWLLGQQNYDKKTQALTMNSVATRTEEQIHIHICPIVQGHQSASTRQILSQLQRKDYTAQSKSVSAVPPGSEMSCRVVAKEGDPIDIGREIVRYLNSGSSCEAYVGAGVMTDNNGWTWGCVTTGHTAAETIFCH
jgi:hypothetical protein